MSEKLKEVNKSNGKVTIPYNESVSIKNIPYFELIPHMNFDRDKFQELVRKLAMMCIIKL